MRLKKDELPGLRPDVSLRRLEQPFICGRRADDLYELSEEAWEFLDRGRVRSSGYRKRGPDFVRYP
jgi:hypothetical protein